MWFQRMSLEDWFDTHQFSTRYDVGESAIKFLKLQDLGLDLNAVDLRYGHHTGAPDLREAISRDYQGLKRDDILVTSGGAEAIFSICVALLKPGDQVIVEHPNYPSTYEVPRGLGCEVELFRLNFEENFEPDLDRLERSITPKTKLLIFTHPNNPTGSMMSPEQQMRLIRLAESRKIYLIFDETYRHLAFGEPLPAAASISPWAISITSMSKCYGLPGIRIGWLASRSPEIHRSVLAVREQVTITNGALSEAIALRVLEKQAAFLDRARAHVDRNLTIATAWLDLRPELEWVRPRGGVVASPRLRAGWIADPEALYRSIAVDHEVFVIPGRCFDMDNRFFRLGFGGTSDELVEGLRRVGQALDAMRVLKAEAAS
jgi:aspartate/methionine/tyrosine aminotransferase